MELLAHQLVKLKEALGSLSVTVKITTLARQLNIAGAYDEEPGLEELMKQMVQDAERFEGRTNDFLASLSLQSDTDTYVHRAQKVALMTMHAAKGLEFPVVFITGCEEGLIPFYRAGEKVDDLEEERRLFYVAMTRAKERLYLTWSKKRTRFGKREQRKVTPFMAAIDPALIENMRTGGRKSRPKHIQQALF